MGGKEDKWGMETEEGGETINQENPNDEGDSGSGPGPDRAEDDGETNRSADRSIA